LLYHVRRGFAGQPRPFFNIDEKLLRCFNIEMTLTKNDQNFVNQRLEVQKEEILDEMDNKLQNLKSDFFNKIDPILKK